jgi:hypothetical protein
MGRSMGYDWLAGTATLEGRKSRMFERISGSFAFGVIPAALEGIFHVALFRHAPTGRVPSGHPGKLIACHGQPKAG